MQREAPGATGAAPQKADAPEGILRHFTGTVPFWGVHAACLLAFWTGVSWFAIGVCLFLYLVRVFGITGGYHRYFSHRSFRTSRPVQFLLALLGTAAVQKGPLWWAALHRHHHRSSDTDNDVHSPGRFGFWWSHVGWILSDKHLATHWDAIKDFARFPELRFLNRYHILTPLALATLLFFTGWILEMHAPSLRTNGAQLLIWGFFVSTTLLYHATFCVNSLAHVLGSRRFRTRDDSRNNLFIALITLGEGWHNNHHRYPSSARNGFFWWEIDVTHYVLKVMSWMRLVWDLREPPANVYAEASRSRNE